MPDVTWGYRSATFEVHQNNGQGFRLLLEPADDPGVFGGMGQLASQSGLVSGAYDRERVGFTIRWGDGKEGAYVGFLFPDGRVRGETSRVDGGFYQPPVAGFWDRFWAPLGLVFGESANTPREQGVGWWSADGYRFVR
jgi:hypothetical protein